MATRETHSRVSVRTAAAGPARALVAAALLGLGAAPGAGALGQPSGGGGAASSIGAEADAAVESYLRREGLVALLAEQLAGRLRRTSGAERRATAEELGRVYVQLIRLSASADERKAWEARAAALVAAEPEAHTYETRRALEEAAYLSLQDAAERARLGQATDAERAEVVESLSSLKRRLEKLGRDSARRVDELERRPAREPAAGGSGEEDRLLKEIKELKEQVRPAAFYYAGWSGVYLALLTGERAPAEEAIAAFGWVLGQGSGRAAELTPEVRAMFRGTSEARSALGVAAALALSGRAAEAARWMSAVDSTGELPQSVRDDLPRWTLELAIAARDWPALADTVARVRRKSPDGALPAVLARLVAVSALTGGGGEGSREVVVALARGAVVDLIRRGQTSQVVELARRSDGLIESQPGFVGAFVRGLVAMDKAVGLHRAAAGLPPGAGADAPEDPTTDASVATAYAEAAAVLWSAAEADDAQSTPGARAQAALLSARSLYLGGQLGAASERYGLARIAAEAAGDAVAAETALWMAVVAADRGVSALPEGSESRAAAQRRLDELTLLYIRTHPAGPRAASLLVRRGDAPGLSDAEVVKLLLAIPVDSELYQAARRQAARVLYRVYRLAPAADRAFAASRFIALAEEVAQAERPAVAEGGQGGAEAAARLVLTARQLLDALLSSPAPDPARARAVLGLLEATAAHAGIDLSSVAGELAFRRFQLALAEGRESEAETLADGLAKPSAGAPARLAESAQRLLYQRRLELWRRAKDDPGAKRDTVIEHARGVLRFGQRVLQQFEPGPVLSRATLEDGAAMSVAQSTAAAGADLWQLARDPEARDAALRIDSSILAAFSNNAGALRRTAELAESVGTPAGRTRAMNAWRTLAAGLPEGGEAWFQARFNFIRMQAEQDPAAARTAIDQIAILYPGLGPEPWSSRIKSLRQMLGGPGSANGGAGGGEGGGGQ